MTEIRSQLSVDRADYRDPDDATIVIDLLDAYALDPMGGGKPLSDHVRRNLAAGLAEVPGAFSLIARLDGRPVGLANCFTGYSTFAAAPLINVHDVVVLPDARGNGVGQALMAAIEKKARKIEACKITLEVLSGNDRAKAVYERCGFGDYRLDPDSGHALFWQKVLT